MYYFAFKINVIILRIPVSTKIHKNISIDLSHSKVVKIYDDDQKNW